MVDPTRGLVNPAAIVGARFRPNPPSSGADHQATTPTGVCMRRTPASRRRLVRAAAVAAAAIALWATGAARAASLCADTRVP
jgi:hypothetical protein